jgi:peptidoglycan/LPS O-acetylase OafA/YrhL
MKASRRMPELDGLRGIAILLVLVWHYVACGAKLKGDPATMPLAESLLRGALGALTSMSWSGVDLFFVLSGFLLGGILLDNKESPSLFKTFYARRICRLFPLYYLSLLLFCFATLVLGSPANRGIKWLLYQPLPIWSYATFTQNFITAFSNSFGANWLGVTWSLAVEEQFYLVLPLIIYFTDRRHLPFVLVTLILAAPLLRVTLLLNQPGIAPGCNYVLFACRADSLLLGVLGAWMVRQELLVKALQAGRTCLNQTLALLLAGVAVFSLNSPHFAADLMGVFGYTWLALTYLLLLLVVLTADQSPLARVCRLAWLRWIGTVSYGIYLLHQVVSGLCHGLILGQPPALTDLSSGLVTALAFALTLLLAGLIYRLFERPFVELGHRFQYEPEDCGRAFVGFPALQ